MNLTVLMPVYNGGEKTKFAIKSILKQTYKDFEFLIVNDGSTDITEEVILSFKDSRINYKKIEHLGISNALNYGINNSSGDYIARMDGDDISLLSRLELQVQEIKKDSSISILSNWYAHMKNYKVFRVVQTPLSNEQIKRDLLKQSVICHASSILKKSDIIKIGLYNPEYEGLEDYELWLRGLNEFTFKNIPQVLYCVNDYGKKEINKNNKQILFDLTNKYLSLYGSAETKFDSTYLYGNKEQLRGLKLPKLNLKYLFRYFYSFMPKFIYNKKIDLWLYWRMLILKTMFSKQKSEINKEIKEIISN
ncbi:MAG TPA: glycosyltransferase [Ignavibacteria bacterium]|nr:glycosyltransferase [Ignavibacteria bacterium]